MKTIKLAYLLLISLILLSACKNSSRKTYAIRDFRDSLQPYLIKSVSKGIVYYNDSIRFFVTNEELVQLSKSEHPVLRAIAFREMLQRKSFDHLEILMTHLDDTALISDDYNENRVKVADDILIHINFKSLADKEKAINEVITKHNNLRLAYGILANIPTQEKYYPYIKEMVLRIREASEEGDERDFGTIEYALYALARFKKPEDVPVIKQKFCDNSWQLGDLSLKTMEEFPKETYLDVLEKMYYDHYLKSQKNKDQQNSTNFFNAVAVYKNERSAKILGAILDSLLSNKHFTIERNFTNHELVYAIWNNPCEAYLKLRRKVAPIVMQEEKRVAEISALYPPGSLDSMRMDVFPPIDTSEKYIYFFR